MAEKMEDTNSWNEMIFQQIRARREWILALIWKKRLELENDTAHGETNEVEEKKNMDLDREDPLFTKWCDERREGFEELLRKPLDDDTVEDKKTSSSKDKMNKLTPEEGNLDVLLKQTLDDDTVGDNEKKVSSVEKGNLNVLLKKPLDDDTVNKDEKIGSSGEEHAPEAEVHPNYLFPLKIPSFHYL